MSEGDRLLPVVPVDFVRIHGGFECADDACGRKPIWMAAEEQPSWNHRGTIRRGGVPPVLRMMSCAQRWSVANMVTFTVGGPATGPEGDRIGRLR